MCILFDHKDLRYLVLNSISQVCLEAFWTLVMRYTRIAVARHRVDQDFQRDS